MARLGIQTIIFGTRAREDFAGVLRDVKAAGYDGAEIGNPTDTRTVAEMKELFDQAGLDCCGYHIGYAGFEDHELLKRTAAHLTGIGSKYLMCSGTAGRDRDGYLRSAETFNKAGALLKDLGVTFCYHNHAWEFEDVFDGERGIHLLARSTNPETVKLCIDVFWVACGEEDPAEFIRRYADRAAYFHYKDGTFANQKAIKFTELGRGQVDLKSATTAALALNPDWITTEQDRTDGEPAESARISAEYARRELGI